MTTTSRTTKANKQKGIKSHQNGNDPESIKMLPLIPMASTL